MLMAQNLPSVVRAPELMTLDHPPGILYDEPTGNTAMSRFTSVLTTDTSERRPGGVTSGSSSCVLQTPGVLLAIAVMLRH